MRPELGDHKRPVMKRIRQLRQSRVLAALGAVKISRNLYLNALVRTLVVVHPHEVFKLVLLLKHVHCFDPRGFAL